MKELHQTKKIKTDYYNIVLKQMKEKYPQFSQNLNKHIIHTVITYMLKNMIKSMANSLNIYIIGSFYIHNSKTSNKIFSEQKSTIKKT